MIAKREQFKLLATERQLRLESIATQTGRLHLWSEELNEAQKDNDRTDDALVKGNHPILDEYLLIAEHGTAALRMGACA